MMTRYRRRVVRGKKIAGNRHGGMVVIREIVYVFPTRISKSAGGVMYTITCVLRSEDVKLLDEFCAATKEKE